MNPANGSITVYESKIADMNQQIDLLSPAIQPASRIPVVANAGSYPEPQPAVASTGATAPSYEPADPVHNEPLWEGSSGGNSGDSGQSSQGSAPLW